VWSLCGSGTLSPYHRKAEKLDKLEKLDKSAGALRVVVLCFGNRSPPMARTTRAQLDQLAAALSEQHGVTIWLERSGSGLAIRQTPANSTAAWEHACGLTASEAKQWLAGALALHSIKARA